MFGNARQLESSTRTRSGAQLPRMPGQIRWWELRVGGWSWRRSTCEQAGPGLTNNGRELASGTALAGFGWSGEVEAWKARQGTGVPSVGR